MGILIRDVLPGSVAAHARVKPLQTLLKIDGHPIKDALDYHFYASNRRVTLTIITNKGKMRMVKLKNEEYDELGLVFDSYLMDKQHACKNHCLFCFIDQLPRGMRESLYFKDDDDRLSFLFGNYITLTNLDEEEVRRIVELKISPINISVHTTNPKLRVEMMKNPNAGEALRFISMLDEGGISLGAQLVLCPGINDGEELLHSLQDLQKFQNMQSVACVPVGVTDHREGLYPLKPYTAAQASAVIDLIEGFGRQREHLAFAADEFYLLAGRPLPDAAYYGAFTQLENGVGMLALFEQEFSEALSRLEATDKKRSVSVATGKAAAPFLEKYLDEIKKKWHNLEYQLYPIENHFFGRHITVTGLLTAQDLKEQLRGKPLGNVLLLSDAMLSFDDSRFLDDTTPQELERQLQVPICFVENNGAVFLEKITG